MGGRRPFPGSTLTRLRSPIGKHDQFHFRLHRVIGFHLHPEVVQTLHPLVHHEFHRKLRALPWLDGRRTDDRFGRSAALLDFDDRLAHDLQGLVADVAKLESGLDRYVKGHLTQINLLPIDSRPGAAASRPPPVAPRHWAGHWS